MWSVRDSSSYNCQVNVKELHKWEPARKKVTSKVEPITAVAFAPIMTLNESSMVLAVGLENGLIEMWSIALDMNNIKTQSNLLHLVPTSDCHISSVKRLSWKPTNEESDEKNEKYWDCTLASCSTDHGVRLFRIEISCNR